MTKTEMIQYIDKEIEIILNMIQKKTDTYQSFLLCMKSKNRTGLI